MLHYCKCDYFSCALALITAIEGMLLAHIGWEWSPGSRKPGYKEIRRQIEAKGSNTGLGQRFHMHKQSALAYLDKWILTDTETMNVEFFFLNRHYVSHAMGPEQFYSAADCNRLLTFFDVYFDFIGYETGVGLRAFVPDSDPFIKARFDYYSLLIVGNVGSRQMVAYEEHLLRQHASYKPERHPLNPIEILNEHGNRLEEAIGSDLFRKIRAAR